MTKTFEIEIHQRLPNSTIKEVIFDYKLFRESSQNFFRIKLFELILKADHVNRSKLFLIYPVEVICLKLEELGVEVNFENVLTALNAAFDSNDEDFDS